MNAETPMTPDSPQPVGASGLLDLFRGGGKLRELLSLIGGNAGKLLELLKGLDLTQLPAVLAAFAELQAAEGWQGANGKLAAGLKLAKAVAAITKTTVDDEVIATIDKLLGDLGLLSLMGAKMNQPTVMGVHVLSEEQQESFKTAGFDIGKLFELIRVIQEIVRLFRGA